MLIPVYSPTIRRKEMDAVLTCMVDEKVGPGALNAQLIKLARDRFFAEGAVAFRSPSIALRYALDALSLETGDKVLLSALAPFWQYQTIMQLKLTPVLLDVSPQTLLVQREAVEQGVASGAKALIFHETVGNVAGVDFYESCPIPIIEDISHSAGARLGERMAGSFGTLSILGLEQQDVITAGGGALLMASDRRVAHVLKKRSSQAERVELLPDINAALAIVQLKQMEKNRLARQEIHRLYVQAVMQAHHQTVLFAEDLDSAVYSFAVILTSAVKAVQDYARKKGIEICLAFEDSCMSRISDEHSSLFQESIREQCPQAASYVLRTVLFPLYSHLSARSVETIVKVLRTLP